MTIRLTAIALLYCATSLAQQPTPETTAQPQPPVRLGGITAGKIITSVPPVYPAEARVNHISGKVVIRAVITKDGTIARPSVISGPEELRTAALDAVSQWIYSPYLLNGEPTEVDTTITVNFNMDSPPPPLAGTATDAGPGKPRGPVRISGGVMAGLILTKVQPAYPPDARANRISGSVVMAALIGKDGRIVDLQAISGPDALLGAALDAVSQWTYKPYALNGEPVEVNTTITVNFSMGPATLRPASFSMSDSGAREPQATPGPVRISAAIMAANLVEHPDPICSPEHKGDKLSGSVVLDAIIAPDGRVANLSVISGPATLQGCVVDAVGQWTYKPYLVNGQPVAVETTITITFDAGALVSPVRISGGILAGNILTRVQPVYPIIAREQHISGAVVLHVIIGADGKVISAVAISGPEMLRGSTIDAIKQWTYKPHLLNGVPTPVDTTITITQSSGGEAEQSVPMHVSGGIIAGTLLSRGGVLKCPEFTSDMHSGTFQMHVIIGADGRISEIYPISGPQPLRSCMAEYIRQWTYRPYLLNGIPTDIETTVTVNVD